MLSEISADALARNIGIPIDTARAAYTMDTITVQSTEQFNDTISAFYLHLLRHTRNVSPPVDARAASGDAHILVERAFSRRGGWNAALAEGCEGTHGGMRLVFDAMTEQFKTEQQEKHINRVLKEALDPRDWDARVAFMTALMKRLSPNLPEHLRARPPEEFAKDYESIVRAYVHSMDRLKDLLRTF